MKLRLTLILLAIALLSAGPAPAQATFTEFTGTETLLPPYLPLGWGTLSCPGGQQTGPWPSIPPCTPGSRVHVRGMKWLYKVETTDPRFRGDEEVIANGNWDGWTIFGPGSGPMWGTLRLEVKAGETKTGEVWEGTWTGIRTVTETGAHSAIRAVAHGSGGSVQGLRAEWEISLDPVSGVGACKGHILAPAGK